MLLAGFRDISPLGTHHALLSVGDPSGSDGQFPCDFFQSHDALMFASGIGTDDFVFPEGVALRVSAGQQLFLNVHLFNTGEEPMSGVSGVSALVVDDADQLAEFTLAGTFDIDIPGRHDHPRPGPARSRPTRPSSTGGRTCTGSAAT
jgi:hypothetical protein